MSWAPNETSAALWVEQADLAGAGIGNIAYGVHMTLFFLCFAALWKGRGRSPTATYAMLAYITALFISGSIGNAAQMRLVEQAYVDDRNFPGGPGAYETEYGSVLASVMSTAAYVVNSWLADGLLVYRFWVIWRARWYVLVVPIMVYLLSISSSIIILVLISQPGNSLWVTTSTNFALMYWGSSISLTILLTLCIVGKLLVMRRRIHTAMGADYKSPYTSIAAMLVESAVLYAAFALAFIITYARNSTVNFLLIQVLGQVQSIAPLLIILRVAQGRGWTRGTNLETLDMSSRGGGIPLRFLGESDAGTGTTAVSRQNMSVKTGASQSATNFFPIGDAIKVEQTVSMHSE